MGTACARASGLLVVWAFGVAVAAAQPTERAPAMDLVRPPAGEGSGLAVFAADPAFATVLDRMWERSPTFRRQCRWFAHAAPGVSLRLRLDHTVAASARARSVVQWRGGTLAAATLYVPAGRAMEEVIAHEMEHVLEQVDRVDLAAHVRSGVAWRHDGGEFETVRAIETGRRVLAEVAAFQRQAGRR